MGNMERRDTETDLVEPRIYTYKVTFPHQGWWYWGAHKEKRYGEIYTGSSVSHPEKWEWFEFEIQILEFFDDWEEAQRVEKRLIKPDLNNPLCLNENEGGILSLESCSKGGKIGGQIAIESGQISALGKSGVGGKVQGKRNVESGQLASISSKGGKVGGKFAVESGRLDRIRTTGSCKKGGETAIKITNSQKWICLVTGEIRNPGNLTQYQRAKGIDTSLRKRIE